MSSTYNTAGHKQVIQRLQHGDKRITDIANNSSIHKGAVHYQVQKFQEQGAVMQMGDQYFLKKLVYSRKRKFRQRMEDFKQKIIRSIKYNTNPEAVVKRYKKYKDQEAKFRKLGVDVPSLSPVEILEEKRTTVRKVMKRRKEKGKIHRKFEQMDEFRSLYIEFEWRLGIDLPDSLRKLPIPNPEARKKIDRIQEIVSG